MEFSEYLTRIQGALLTLNRRDGLRKSPNVEEGNEIKISAFYNALRKILTECKDNESDMRNIHLYLLFNSDFAFNEEVAKEEDFCHIALSAPTIDKFLLAETVLVLDINQFIFEVIHFSHVTISLEYLGVLLHELQSKKVAAFISVVEGILSAVRERLFSLENETSAVCKNIHLVKFKFSYYFKNFLKLFSPPHDDCEMGYVVKSLLSLLHSFLAQQHSAVPQDHLKYNIYALTLADKEIEASSEDYLDLKKNDDVHSLLKMLESNLSLVNLSTWMYWSECEWHPSTSMVKCSKTVQEMVGEQAFLCKQQLQRVCSDMPEAATLSSVLSNMEIKPFKDEDEIEVTQDPIQMISKLKEPCRTMESKKKWLLGLLRISWNSKEEECVECIQEFRHLLTFWEDVHLLQQKIAKSLTCVSICQPLSDTKSNDSVKLESMSEPLKEKMKDVVFKTYSQISVENQGKLVGLFCEEFGLNEVFHDKNFDKIAIETFNKTVNMSENKNQLLSDLCVLCLKSPIEAVQRLLVLGIGCYSQIYFVIEVLKLLKSVCHLHVDGNLLTTQEKSSISSERNVCLLCHQLSLLMKQSNWNETEKSNLIHLVVQSLEASVLPHESFLYGCIFPGMKECLENASWNVVNLHIEVLTEVLTQPSFTLGNTASPAPILVYVLLVLEQARCDMRKNLSITAASTCELLISCLPVLQEKMADKVSSKEKDLCWLRENVLLSSPLSQCYYHRLWPNTTKGICKDYRSLIMFTVSNTLEVNEEKLLYLLTSDHSLLSHSLFRLLPSCTTSEWINIVHILKGLMPESKEAKEKFYWKLLNVISSVLSVMIIAAKRKHTSGNKEPLYCIELWFKNFIRIIKEEFWPCCKYFSMAESADVFFIIIRILLEIPEDENIRETCSFLALNVLFDIIKSNFSPKTKSIEIISKTVDCNPELLKLISCVSLMSEGETKRGLARKINEFLYPSNLS